MDKRGVWVQYSAALLTGFKVHPHKNPTDTVDKMWDTDHTPTSTAEVRCALCYTCTITHPFLAGAQ